MKNLFQIFLVIVLAGSARSAQPLPRSTPEAQGVASAAMIEFVQALDQIDGLHGVVVLRHGQMIAGGWWAPYDAAHQHVLYSLSKSFTSTAVGCAVAQGKLSLDDAVLKFFPADAPANPSANLKAMRVRDQHGDFVTVAPVLAKDLRRGDIIRMASDSLRIEETMLIRLSPKE